MPHERIRKFTLNVPGPAGTGDDVAFGLCMAVRAGNRVFLRGQVGVDLDGVYAGDDPAAQTETAMANVAALLTDAGADLTHICKTTIYITDRAYREPVYSVVGRWLQGVYPCQTGLIVSGLAKPEYKIEIDVEAVIPD